MLEGRLTYTIMEGGVVTHATSLAGLSKRCMAERLAGNYTRYPGRPGDSRDRRGTFQPQLIAKYQRRFPGFDDKIISMYARDMSVRDIQGHLREPYGIEASPQLISTETDAVLEEVNRWQARPLDAVYAIVFFDALRVKMRYEGRFVTGLCTCPSV
jgi:hypothetical protein